MEVYLYCSYTGSPVGFIMGKTVREESGKWTEMSEDNLASGIRACFEYGIIKNVIGNINILLDEESKAEWVILLKNLVYKVPDTEDNFTWYINTALVTRDKSEFEKWICGVRLPDMALSIYQCLEVDKTVRFGYTVDFNKLDIFIDDLSLAGIIPEPIRKKALDYLCLEFQKTLPGDKREDFISKHIEKRHEPAICSPEGLENWSICEKKKIALGNGMITLMTILVLLAMIGIGLLVMNKVKMEEAESVIISGAHFQQSENGKKIKPL